MAIFCLITRRRIKLVRLILNFIALAMNAKRRRHAPLSYGMFLTRVFRRAQLPIDGHKADNRHTTTTMKTFLALRLKPQGSEKEKRKGNEKKKRRIRRRKRSKKRRRKIKRKRKRKRRRRTRRRKILLSRKMMLLLRRIDLNLLKRRKRRY